MVKKGSAEETIRDIKRKTRRKHSAEDKIRIVLEGLRGEDTVAELCRREGIAVSSQKSGGGLEGWCEVEIVSAFVNQVREAGDMVGV
jgi:hypothetical protein